MIRRLILDAQTAQMARREARNALPAECCGLIEGETQGEDLRVIAFHPSRNLAREPGRFEIDPKVQFKLMRALRGTDRAVVGCYHSHPNGKPEPSLHDEHGGGEKGFVWLIVALRDGEEAFSAHICEGTYFRAISIVERAD